MTNGSCRAYTRATSDGENLDAIFGESTSAPKTIEFTPTVNASYIRVLANTTVDIAIVLPGTIDKEIADIQDDITEIEGDITDINTAITGLAGDISGSTSYSIDAFTALTIFYLPDIGQTVSLTPSASSYNSTLIVPIKAGQRVRANLIDTTRRNGIGIVDSENILRQKIGFPSNYDQGNNKFYPIEFIAVCDGKMLVSAYPTLFKGLVVYSEIDSRITNGLSESIWAPYPQLPADDSESADFDSDAINTQDIYNYIDALAEKHPNYITKEVLGKESSGNLDVNRYTLHSINRFAWVSTTTPLRYKWTDGARTFWTNHYSPRAGDPVYNASTGPSTTYNVSAVNNANRTITVNGGAVTRAGNNRADMVLVYSLTTVVGAITVQRDITQVSTIASVVGNLMTDALGNTYYRYPFGDLGTTEPLGTIYIGANEHGPTSDPRECAIVVSRMIKDLSEGSTKTNHYLNILRRYFNFVIIPVANPYGFDNNTRTNSNNVNINRNYDTAGWSSQSDTDKGDYGGSEIETQYLIDSVMDSNAIVALDIHCLGNVTQSNDGKCHWAGVVKNEYAMRQIIQLMKDAYELSCSSYGTGDYTAGATGDDFFAQVGIDGMLLEFQSRDGVTGSGQLHTARILEANYTFMLNIINMLASNYNDMYDVSKAF